MQSTMAAEYQPYTPIVGKESDCKLLIRRRRVAERPVKRALLYQLSYAPISFSVKHARAFRKTRR
jgi:hypothetical protein